MTTIQTSTWRGRNQQIAAQNNFLQIDEVSIMNQANCMKLLPTMLKAALGCNSCKMFQIRDDRLSMSASQLSILIQWKLSRTLARMLSSSAGCCHKTTRAKHKARNKCRRLTLYSSSICVRRVKTVRSKLSKSCLTEVNRSQASLHRSKSNS